MQNIREMGKVEKEKSTNLIGLEHPVIRLRTAETLKASRRLVTVTLR